MSEHDSDGNSDEFIDRVQDLNRVLEVGRLLLSVLTQEELDQLTDLLSESTDEEVLLQREFSIGE